MHSCPVKSNRDEGASSTYLFKAFVSDVLNDVVMVMVMQRARKEKDEGQN